jgi:hypothetical protein
MPRAFQFIQDNEPVGLNRIDDEVCDFYGVSVDETNFSMAYEIITMTGLGILMSQGGSEVTEGQLEKYISECDPPLESKIIDLLREFLVKRYTYKAWYESKY